MNKTKQLIFSGHELLLLKEGDNYFIPGVEEHDSITFTVDPRSIGIHHDYSCYVSEIEKPIKIENGHAWMPLKSAIEHLGVEWFSVAARAYQVINWEKNHRFCGRCGKETIKMSEGFERRCEACQLFFFPRISPSIIVLIKKGQQILLARQAQFAPGVYALIAGFVEAGETLEEAVHREVKEEVGIIVKNIRYFGSQPWPFPDSLMVAFIADYESGEIDLVDGELEKAGWYDANDLPGLPSSSISISRQLIDCFLNEEVDG